MTVTMLQEPERAVVRPVRRPALRYHGGKWNLAPWIVAQFPPHRIYTEAYGGAASASGRKPRSYAEVYNDVWDDVVTVFRVLRDPAAAARLEELLRLTPYARTEFRDVSAADAEEIDPVELARRIVFRSLAGFGSGSSNLEYATGFRTSRQRRGTTPATDWRNYPGHVRSFTGRLQGVTIECRPALDVLRDHDGRDTLHYVDPPYVHATRNVRERNLVYAHEMQDEDHRELAEVLRRLEGMVVLSGYRSALYDRLYRGWLRLERVSLADGARRRVECLWLNPAAADQHRGRLHFEAAK